VELMAEPRRMPTLINEVTTALLGQR